MIWRLMAGRIWPVAARLGRLEQQQGVGASSLKMLTGGIRWYHLGGGYWWCSRGLSPTVSVSRMLLSALPSEYLRCFSQPHLLSFLVVFSYLAVSGFCIVFLKFHVSYFLK